MKNKQPAVFKKSSKALGIKKIWIDEHGTEDMVKELLKSNGIKQVIYTDGKDSYSNYPISVSRVESRYSSIQKKYRIYFSIGGNRKSYIQSDSDGIIEIPKFLKKSTEMFLEAQVVEDNFNNKRAIQDNNEDYVNSLNEGILADSSFKARTSYGRIELVASSYNIEEFNKLLKLIK